MGVFWAEIRAGVEMTAAIGAGGGERGRANW
jgi:hypothetical protein